MTVVLLAIWQLPWCYAFFNTESAHLPFTLYSGLYGDFISVDRNKETGAFGIAADGKTFSQEQTDSLLPFFYMRQLMADSRMPDTIQNVPVSAHDIQMTNFNFRSSASDLNVNKVELYPLLESLSKRVELTMSEDVFRITDKGIEFIRMAANEIYEAKSQKFTKALLDKGFSFPSRKIAGNPTTKKDYDEGYLIVDNNGKLFHMKMMQGQPYVRFIELPKDVEIKNLFLTEFRDKKTLGFIQDSQNRFFVLNNKTYQLFNTGVTDCDLNRYDMTIIGNMMDWTMWILKDNSCDFYALDANNYSVIKKMSKPIADISAFGLHFTSPSDKFVYPRF